MLASFTLELLKFASENPGSLVASMLAMGTLIGYGVFFCIRFVSNLHAGHAAEIKAIHAEYASKVKAADERSIASHKESLDRITSKQAEAVKTIMESNERQNSTMVQLMKEHNADILGLAARLGNAKP